MKVRDRVFLKTLVRIYKTPAKIKCVQSMIYVTFTEIQSIIILISDWKNGRKKREIFYYSPGQNQDCPMPRPSVLTMIFVQNK